MIKRLGLAITDASPALLSIRLHLVIGLAVVLVLAGGLGGWAATAKISGALIAPGQALPSVDGPLTSRPAPRISVTSR